MIQKTTHLAWKNLTAAPNRFALACGAIGFAVVLMFLQAGFRHALLDSPVKMVEVLGGDLVAVSPARYTLAAEMRFPDRFLNRMESDPDVTSVTPIYIERWITVLRIPRKPAKTIRVIGLPIKANAVDDPQLQEKLHLLSRPLSALIDRHSKRSFGIPISDFQAMRATEIELMGRRLQLVGRVTIGADFAHDGNLIVSDRSFAEFFSFRNHGDPLGVVDMALVSVRPGADPIKVRDRLNDQLNPRINRSAHNDLSVMTRQEIIDRERTFWATSTPIGVIFTAGMLVGFAVGVIICYQILFTEIHDHMGEFATLKAMGYGNRYFLKVVLQQAVYLASCGFVPGVIVSALAFYVLQIYSGLPLEMTGPRVLWIFCLTIAMCLLGGLLAMRKLINADPAKLF